MKVPMRSTLLIALFATAPVFAAGLGVCAAEKRVAKKWEGEDNLAIV